MHIEKCNIALYISHMEKTNWIGFDLGGTKMLALAFDEKFKEIGRSRRKTKASEGMKAGLCRIVETIEETLTEAKVSKESIAGIGIGVPGPLDHREGVIIDAPNLGWKDMPLKKTLAKAFGCDVVVVNDVDAGVYGEYSFGAAQGAHCALGVFPGTGIGAGCVYRGQLIQGSVNSCMELGHIPVLPEGPICGCGKRGCLEAVASRLAISAAVAAEAFRGHGPTILRECGTDISNIRSKALAQSIAAGEKAVEDIVRQAARWLGRGVATAMNLFAPDIVVLGGGLVEAMPELYIEEVKKSATAIAMPAYAGMVRFTKAKLGDDATAMGAAAWARAEVRSVS